MSKIKRQEFEQPPYNFEIDIAGNSKKVTCFFSNRTILNEKINEIWYDHLFQTKIAIFKEEIFMAAQEAINSYTNTFCDHTWLICTLDYYIKTEILKNSILNFLKFGTDITDETILPLITTELFVKVVDQMKQHCLDEISKHSYQTFLN